METMLAPKLLAADRCDVRCPAQAQVRYRYPGDGLLDFCAHHADTYEVSLLASGCILEEDRRAPEKETVADKARRRYPLPDSKGTMI